MKRRPTTQDITWLLDLERNKQLDLDPPYQRRSVWTKKDRQLFLDTIFRDYPSPAIFLHKSVSSDGKAMYYVVDGKQRLQTILDFSQDNLRIAKDFGDIRLDGKKWSELEGETELRHSFWNYEIPVEMVNVVDGAVVNEMFDRLNRNSRKLTRQELRHAKYDGWLITTVEAEADKADWKKLGVVTPAREKRMADTQFLSELMLVILKRRVLGFDPDELDEFYADYDDPSEGVVGFSEQEFTSEFEQTKTDLMAIEQHQNVVSRFAKSFAHLYTLWSVLALNRDRLKPPTVTASLYAQFMQKVETLAAQKNLDEFLAAGNAADFQNAYTYYNFARGASTDLKPRQERYAILRDELL